MTFLDSHMRLFSGKAVLNPFPAVLIDLENLVIIKDTNLNIYDIAKSLISTLVKTKTYPYLIIFLNDAASLLREAHAKEIEIMISRLVTVGTKIGIHFVFFTSNHKIIETLLRKNIHFH